MSHLYISKNKGFTLLEVIVVSFIAILISGIVYSPLSDLNNRQVLDKEVAQVESYIQKSRMNSINAKNGDAYGITFSTSTVKVVSIIASSTTILYTLNNRVRLASSTLNAGGLATTTVIFSRLTGLPSATGTLMYVYLSGSQTIGTSSITINGLGITQ